MTSAILASVAAALCAAASATLFRRFLRMPPSRRRWLTATATFCAGLAAVDLIVWVATGGGYFWPAWTILGLSALLSLHAWIVSRPPGRRERELAARVGTLTRSRSEALDRQATELKRVERDLHDGAQARMVSLALTLGLAGRMVRRDPDGAERLLDEARSTARAALEDLRAVMHSIHPPVLADRGLGDAVRALVLDLAVPVTVTGDPPSGLNAATETAAYFAVAECLSNVVKHSGATAAEVTFADRLIIVTDNGKGGADPAAGSGLRGITDRLDAVDARLEVDSPPGGPTRIVLRIPI